jgi:hypothetical protein
MGRDFSINCSDSTCKGVSYIMFKMVKLVSQPIADDIDDILNEDKFISVKQLAEIIYSLRHDLIAVQHNSEFKAKFVECYKFYTDDAFEEVLENCKRACDLFTNALLDSILCEEDRVYWDYS